MPNIKLIQAIFIYYNIQASQRPYNSYFILFFSDLALYFLSVLGSIFRCQLYDHEKITGTKENTSLDFEVWLIDVHDEACVDLAVPQNM